MRRRRHRQSMRTRIPIHTRCPTLLILLRPDIMADPAFTSGCRPWCLTSGSADMAGTSAGIAGTRAIRGTSPAVTQYQDEANAEQDDRDQRGQILRLPQLPQPRLLTTRRVDHFPGKHSHGHLPRGSRVFHGRCRQIAAGWRGIDRNPSALARIRSRCCLHPN